MLPVVRGSRASTQGSTVFFVPGTNPSTSNLFYNSIGNDYVGGTITLLTPTSGLGNARLATLTYTGPPPSMVSPSGELESGSSNAESESNGDGGAFAYTGLLAAVVAVTTVVVGILVVRRVRYVHKYSEAGSNIDGVPLYVLDRQLLASRADMN